MGVVLICCFELFKVVVSFVFLLDMFCFYKLLVGVSWVVEYGNLENLEERVYLVFYFFYYMIKKDILYFIIFIISFIKDDRVYFGYGWKMVVKMKEMGYDVFYVENIDGGYFVGVNWWKIVYIVILYYVFFY